MSLRRRGFGKICWSQETTEISEVRGLKWSDGPREPLEEAGCVARLQMWALLCRRRGSSRFSSRTGSKSLQIGFQGKERGWFWDESGWLDKQADAWKKFFFKWWIWTTEQQDWELNLRCVVCSGLPPCLLIHCYLFLVFYLWIKMLLSINFIFP